MVEISGSFQQTNFNSVSGSSVADKAKKNTLGAPANNQGPAAFKGPNTDQFEKFLNQSSISTFSTQSDNSRNSEFDTARDVENASVYQQPGLTAAL